MLGEKNGVKGVKIQKERTETETLFTIQFLLTDFLFGFTVKPDEVSNIKQFYSL